MKSKKYMDKYYKIIIDTVEKIFVMDKQDKINLYYEIKLLSNEEINKLMAVLINYIKKDLSLNKWLMLKVRLTANSIEELIEKQQISTSFNFNY